MHLRLTQAELKAAARALLTMALLAKHLRLVQHLLEAARSPLVPQQVAEAIQGQLRHTTPRAMPRHGQLRIQEGRELLIRLQTGVTTVAGWRGYATAAGLRWEVGPPRLAPACARPWVGACPRVGVQREAGTPGGDECAEHLPMLEVVKEDERALGRRVDVPHHGRLAGPPHVGSARGRVLLSVNEACVTQKGTVCNPGCNTQSKQSSRSANTLPRYRSARVSPASGVALGPAGPAADSRGRRRVVQPSALHMCPDPDPRLTTNADRAFHVGMANDKQPRHDNLKARCLPQATSPLHGCSPGVPFVHHPLPYALLYFHPAASLPASIARLWKVRDTTRELRVFPGIMPVCFWAECHIIGLHVLRPTWIMSQAGQRAVSFHALVVLLLALVTTAGALTQSIGNTGDFDALQSYVPVLASPETYIICFAPTH